MTDFFTAKDIEEMLSDPCADQEIDVIEFANHAEEIRSSWNKAFDEFVKIQESRVPRFKRLYEELDKFDPPALLEELEQIQSRRKMVRVLEETTKPILSLIKKKDSQWIKHPKYNGEFFECLTYQFKEWKKRKPSRDEVLETLSDLYDLGYKRPQQCDSSSSDENY